MTLEYRGFRITYAPKPIPASCGVDYDWWHPDFDGADDSNDRRCGAEASIDACKAAIDEYLEVV